MGFVTRVYPGIKENAAIFSHPNAWPIVAEAVLGRGDRAVELYDAILPYNQNDNIEVKNPDHVGRGIKSVTIDGVEHDAEKPLPVLDEGSEVQVVITLG